MTQADRKLTLAWAMKKLPFVMWDRYIDNGPSITAYGWIDRPTDTYKDFVMLEAFPETEMLSYTTSSALRSKEIAELLFGDSEGHEDCKRVEIGFQEFDIKNVIKLK